MVQYYIISSLFLFALFIMFLVISKTLNGVINQLMKIEYLVTRENEYYSEGLEIRQMMVDKIDEASSN